MQNRMFRILGNGTCGINLLNFNSTVLPGLPVKIANGMTYYEPATTFIISLRNVVSFWKIFCHEIFYIYSFRRNHIRV